MKSLDKVVCLYDNDGAGPRLKKGKVYIIKEIEQPQPKDERWSNVSEEWYLEYMSKGHLVLEGIDESWSFPVRQFITLTEFRKKKLERICCTIKQMI
ncbi:MAG: hypothetical protein HPY57_14650 [Ignavibacteria bacterium]|nr:hypothetical protein [Ignavibacteria bacterium]